MIISNEKSNKKNGFITTTDKLQNIIKQLQKEDEDDIYW